MNLTPDQKAAAMMEGRKNLIAILDSAQQNNVEALRDALSHVENIECATRVSQDTIEAAKYILKVREIVMMEEPEEPYVWCSSLYLFLSSYRLCHTQITRISLTT